MRTTSQHFTIFQKACRRYLALFGLTDWKVYFRHEEIKDAYALCSSTMVERVATISLSTDWGNTKRPLTTKEITRTALHECVHLVVRDLYVAGSIRYMSDGEHDRCEESAVRRIENAILILE